MARAFWSVTFASSLALAGCDPKSEPETKDPVEATAPPADEPDSKGQDSAPTPEQAEPASAEPEPETTVPELDDGGDGPEDDCYDKCMRAHMMEARSAESIEQDCKNECKGE